MALERPELDPDLAGPRYGGAARGEASSLPGPRGGNHGHEATAAAATASLGRPGAWAAPARAAGRAARGLVEAAMRRSTAPLDGTPVQRGPHRATSRCSPAAVRRSSGHAQAWARSSGRAVLGQLAVEQPRRAPPAGVRLLVTPPPSKGPHRQPLERVEHPSPNRRLGPADHARNLGVPESLVEAQQHGLPELGREVQQRCADLPVPFGRQQPVDLIWLEAPFSAVLAPVELARRGVGSSGSGGPRTAGG